MKKFILLILCPFFVSVVLAQTQTQSQPASPPPSTDIFLIHLKNGKIDPAKIRNITHRKGYDNQPRFLPDSRKLFYTSIGEDGQADIYLYDVAKAAASKITATAESEYSPTLTPDGQFFSTVRVEKDNTQRLWKFPLNGGDPILILEQIKPVGYHAWTDSNTLALFILGEPPTLQIADIVSGKSSLIASNIGRSLHQIPGKTQISFVQLSEQKGTIKEYDPKTKQTRDLIPLLPETEDYTWFGAGSIYTAKNSKIYSWTAGEDKDWKEEADLMSSGIKKISRMNFSPDGNWLALVAEE